VTPVLQRFYLEIHQLAVKCKVKIYTARNVLRLEIYYETRNYLQVSYKTKITKTKIRNFIFLCTEAIELADPQLTVAAVDASRSLQRLSQLRIPADHQNACTSCQCVHLESRK